MHILKIDDLYVNYGKEDILRDVNVEIEEKAITSIIGPSGCGKTSFINTINRMIEENGGHYRGKILLKGQDIKEMEVEKLRKNVGMVFQSPSPFPMSIYDNLVYAPRYYGVRNKSSLNTIVEDSLKRVGLFDEVKDKLDKSALELSGGQQQRLCIARALTVEPKILILDEPCSALDVKNTKIIEDLLVKLSVDYTIIIVTHNLGQAKRISDYTLFFLEGELVEKGSSQALFTQPQRKDTKEYIYLFE